MPRTIRILILDVLGRMRITKVLRSRISQYIPAGKKGRRTVWVSLRNAARIFKDATRAVRTFTKRKSASRRGTRSISGLKFSEYKTDVRLPVNNDIDIDSAVKKLWKLYKKVAKYDPHLGNQSLRVALVSSESRFTASGKKRRRVMKGEIQAWISTKTYRRGPGNDEIMFKELEEKLRAIEDEYGYQGLTVSYDEERDIGVFAVAFEEI